MEEQAQGTTPAEPPAVYCVLHDGVVSFVSSNTLAVSGLAPERFHGRHALDLVHPDDRERVALLLVPGRTGAFEETLRLQEASGVWSWRLVSGVRTFDDGGHASAVLTLRKVSGPAAGR